MVCAWVQFWSVSPVNSPHKGQWGGALIFSLNCARINDWVNNREAGDLRRHCAHYDATVILRPVFIIIFRAVQHNLCSRSPCDCRSVLSERRRSYWRHLRQLRTNPANGYRLSLSRRTWRECPLLLPTDFFLGLWNKNLLWHHSGKAHDRAVQRDVQICGSHVPLPLWVNALGLRQKFYSTVKIYSYHMGCLVRLLRYQWSNPKRYG